MISSCIFSKLELFKTAVLIQLSKTTSSHQGKGRLNYSAAPVIASKLLRQVLLRH